VLVCRLGRQLHGSQVKSITDTLNETGQLAQLHPDVLFALCLTDQPAATSP
jgi:hypothetical protein